MTHTEEATIACKYALGYGHLALQEHFNIWLDESLPYECEDDSLYAAALKIIKSKLGTEQCLLK